MPKVVFLMFSLLICASVTYQDQEHRELKQVPPRAYPYVVDIEIDGHEWCHGVLITTNYVLTNARCVVGSRKNKIYLGWYSYPEYQDPVNESDSQIFSSMAVSPHPDYKEYKKYWNYSNDIALVKLSQAVSITGGVKPAELADPKTFNDSDLTGQYATVFGWWPVAYLSAATVQIRSSEECRDIFGRNYIMDRQLCAKWPSGERLCSHHSLPLEINGVLIGLQQDDPQNDVECLQFEYKFLNILFYYDWILENSDLREYIRKSDEDEQKEIELQSPSKEKKESTESNNFEITKKRCKIDIELACPSNTKE